MVWSIVILRSVCVLRRERRPELRLELRLELWSVLRLELLVILIRSHLWSELRSELLWIIGPEILQRNIFKRIELTLWAESSLHVHPNRIRPVLPGHQACNILFEIFVSKYVRTVDRVCVVGRRRLFQTHVLRWRRIWVVVLRCVEVLHSACVSAFGVLVISRAKYKNIKLQQDLNWGDSQSRREFKQLLS